MDRVSPTPDRLVRMLTERYWTIPKGVAIRVQLKKPDGTRTLWRVPSLKQALEHHTYLRGEVELRDGTRVLAVVLSEAPRTNVAGAGAGAISRARLYTDDDRPIARVAVVYQGECYVHTVQGATNRIRRFGFTYQPSRVQLLVFPPQEKYQPTDTRSGLEPNPNALPGQNGLPWEEWADEFRHHLRTGQALADLRHWQDSLEAGSEEEDRRLLLDVLIALSTVRRAVATGRGTQGAGRRALGGGPSSKGGRADKGGRGAGGGTRGTGPSPRRGRGAESREAGDDERRYRERLSRVMPEVTWTPIEDPNDDLFGRAGSYVPGENRIILNSKWKEFDTWRDEVGEELCEPSNATPVESLVRLSASALAIDSFFAVHSLNRTLDQDRLEQAMLAGLSRRAVLREMRRRRREQRSEASSSS